MFLSRTLPAVPGGQWYLYAPRLPRITVVGDELRRLGVRFKSWGYQQLNYFYMAGYFTVGGEAERDQVAIDIAGNRGMGANTIRLHMDLWWFIDGPNKDALEVLPGPLENLLFFLEVCRQNGVYVLLSGNNTWDPSIIPGWFDELSYADRWDVSEFFWIEIATAVVGSGNASAVLGYELANEPSMNADPDWEWYGDDVFGIGIYYRHLIARGPDVGDATVRDWIIQLRDAIKAVDPQGLVTVGTFPFFTGSFGYENIEDLLDFLSPHCYPPFEFFGQTLEEMLGYLNGWTASIKPLVIGETSLWSLVPSNNTDYMDALLAADYDGVINFSYGYAPEEFTVPPDPPLFPADPTLAADIYAAQGSQLALFNTYRIDFLGA